MFDFLPLQSPHVASEMVPTPQNFDEEKESESQQMSNRKLPGCLGHVRDDTTQLLYMWIVINHYEHPY